MNKPAHSTPTHFDIERRARDLWLTHGSPAGRDLEFWLEAQRQLNAEQTTDSAKFRSATPRRGQQSFTADEIDETELIDRMDDFGEPARRSPTSLI